MSLGDIFSRSDALLKKYEKYVVKEDKRAELGLAAADAFMDEYAFILAQADELTTKAQTNSTEQNRALRAAINAEIRRNKAALLEGNLEALLKLVKKGKKVTPEIVQDRLHKVEALRTTVHEIPDGIHGSRLSPKKKAFDRGAASGTTGGSPVNIEARFHSSHYFEQTAESSAFRQEWEVNKAKQDRSLENIERGLGVLGEAATAMGENVQHQDALVDAVTEKMDEVTQQLKTNNMKMHHIITQVRSTKHFCIDVILIGILLSIGIVIFRMYKK